MSWPPSPTCSTEARRAPAAPRPTVRRWTSRFTLERSDIPPSIPVSACWRWVMTTGPAGPVPADQLAASPPMTCSPKALPGGVLHRCGGQPGRAVAGGGDPSLRRPPIRARPLGPGRRPGLRASAGVGSRPPPHVVGRTRPPPGVAGPRVPRCSAHRGSSSGSGPSGQRWQCGPRPSGVRRHPSGDEPVDHVATPTGSSSWREAPMGGGARDGGQSRLVDATFLAAMRLVDPRQHRPGELRRRGRGARSGHPEVAVLDVTREEPSAGHPFWRAVLTPHDAASGHGRVARLADLFRTNLARYLTGQPLLLHEVPRPTGSSSLPSLNERAFGTTVSSRRPGCHTPSVESNDITSRPATRCTCTARKEPRWNETRHSTWP